VCRDGLFDVPEHAEQAEADFARASKAGADGAYAPLAQLGLAAAGLYTNEEDLLLRVQAERALLELRGSWEGWSEDVQSLIPALLCRSLQETEWIEQVTIITTPKEFTAWQNGFARTIPWVVPSDDKFVGELADKSRDRALGGGVVFVNGPLFVELSHLRAGETPPELLRGEAIPVPAAPFPFLQGIQSVPYDVTATGELVNTKTAAREKALSVLAANAEWLVCACRDFRRGNVGGTVVSLPDRLGATQDACRFLRQLIEHSQKGMREMGANR